MTGTRLDFCHCLPDPPGIRPSAFQLPSNMPRSCPRHERTRPKRDRDHQPATSGQDQPKSVRTRQRRSGHACYRFSSLSLSWRVSLSPSSPSLSLATAFWTVTGWPSLRRGPTFQFLTIRGFRLIGGFATLARMHIYVHERVWSRRGVDRGSGVDLGPVCGRFWGRVVGLGLPARD